MPRKHLFISYNEIAALYPFQDNISFADLLPTIRTVERTYLQGSTAKFIDPLTWADVLAELDAETPNEYWADLAERVSTACALLVALRHMPKSNVIYSASGMLVAKTESTVPASEYRTEELKAELMKSAQEALDEVVGYLEDNLAVFEDWAASDERGKLNDLIIRTAFDFDQSYSIAENRWIFRKLLARQRSVIRTHVKGELGSEFVTAFLADMEDGILNADHQEILPLLHSAVALLTYSESLPMLSQQFGPEGIAIFDSNMQRQPGRRQAEDQNQIRLLQNTLLEQGKQDLRMLKSTLDQAASVTRFPEYFAGTSYADPLIDSTDLNDEDTNTNHWAMG